MTRDVQRRDDLAPAVLDGSGNRAAPFLKLLIDQ